MDTRTLLPPWRRLLSAVLVVPLLLAASAILVSARWIDLPGGDLQSYGISESEVARISQGFGLRWEPYRQMSRAQFAKMLRQAGEVAPAAPGSPSYSDVAPGSRYYGDIEGVTAAGLLHGVGGGAFGPDLTLTREQGVAAIARYLAAKTGVDLAARYPGDAALERLSGFVDTFEVSPSLLRELAYARELDILRGSDDGGMHPRAALLRVQSAALLIRSLDSLPPTTIHASTSDTEADPGTTVDYAYIDLIGMEVWQVLFTGPYAKPIHFTFTLANRGNAPVRGHVELTVTDEWGQVVFAAQTDAITLGVGETGTLAPSDIRTEWGPTVGGTYAVVARAVGGLVDGRTEMREVYTFLGPAQPWPSDTTITQ